MRIIKKLILPIALILMIAMFCISVADATEKEYTTDFNRDNIMSHVEKLTENGPRSVAHKEANEAAVSYIASQLESFGLVSGDTTDAPAYSVQEYVAKDEKYQNWYLKNVIAHIPANSAEPTGEAVMFMAHFDSVPMGEGASDDAIAIGVMLEAARYYSELMKDGFELKNDLVFCFVNGEEYGLYGSKAFMEEFSGFDNVVERIKFATNLESRGTSGTLIMFETADNNYNTLKLFSEINKNVYTCSIATMVYDSMPNGTDFSNFKEYYQGLNMANITGGENYHTQNDSYENVGKAYLSQQALIVDTIIEKLADYDLDRLYDADESAVFFSYLNVTTVVYNHLTVILLAVILIILLALNGILRAKGKQGSVKKTALSVVTAVVALIASAAVTYGLYYLFQLIAALAGAIDFNMIGTITYSNVYIVVAIGLVCVAVSALAARFAVKKLSVEYSDLTRGFAYIHAFLGIVLSFALADASYLFVFSGIMLMICELISTFRKKASSIPLEIIATALYFPIVIPVIFLATSALGMTMAYVYGFVFAITVYDVGVTVARITSLKAEKVVKARLTVLTALALFLAACIILTAVSVTKLNASVNLQGKQSIPNLPYDDALVYVVNADGEDEYRVYDLNAYGYLKEYAPEMEYSGEYYCGEGEKVDVEYTITSAVADGKLEVKKYNEDTLVYLSFKDIKAKSFTIDDGTSSNTYDLTDSDTYSVTIHSECVVTVNGGTAAVEYREVLRDYANLIPDGYDKAEQLHFNLWLTDEMTLGK